MEANTAGEHGGEVGGNVRARKLQAIEELWHAECFAGRQGRGAMDSVMLMDRLRKETRGEVYGRDITFVFNSIVREKMVEIVREQNTDVARQVDQFLEPRKFQVTVGGRMLTSMVIVPQGSPLSPSLFTIYMSKASRMGSPTEGSTGERVTRAGKGKGVFIPLTFIDDSNSVTVGNVKETDEALKTAAREFGLTWDHEKDWKNGVYLGVNLDAKKHMGYRLQKAQVAFAVIRRLSRLPPREKR